ncbi:MAG: hypothetical protein NVS3B20_22050 [Polyangiales bacterium]
MFGLSWGELMVVGIIMVLIFGWSWVPRIGEGIGDLFSGVRKGMREDDARIEVKQLKPTKKGGEPGEHDEKKGDGG